MCRAHESFTLSISISVLYNLLHIFYSAPRGISEPALSPIALISPAQSGLFGKLAVPGFPTKLNLNVSSSPFLCVLLIILSYHRCLCSLWIKRTSPSQVLLRSLSQAQLPFYSSCPHSCPNHGKVAEGDQCSLVVYPKC